MIRLNLLQSRPEPFRDRPTRDLSRLLQCPCCDGLGFLKGVLYYPFVTPCGCTAGLRLRSSLQDWMKPWPMGITSAEKLSERLGLVIADGRAARHAEEDAAWRADGTR